MCEQCFDNNGNSVTESDFIRINVLDTDGFHQEVTCPECGKNAIQRDFDECLGGAINSVYTINCPHCGYHECDQEYCATCEVNYEASFAAKQDEMSHLIRLGEILEYRFDAVLDDVKNEGLANPVVWSMVKSIAYQSNEAIQFCCIEGVALRLKPHEFIAALKKQLLDAKFNRNLDLKIAKAKTETLVKHGLALEIGA
jgi:predicted RNA-binding Zn-ribbon protein involved in translation (DUF1610 family)